MPKRIAVYPGPHDRRDFEEPYLLYSATQGGTRLQDLQGLVFRVLEADREGFVIEVVEAGATTPKTLPHDPDDVDAYIDAMAKHFSRDIDNLNMNDAELRHFDFACGFWRGFEAARRKEHK